MRLEFGLDVTLGWARGSVASVVRAIKLGSLPEDKKRGRCMQESSLRGWKRRVDSTPAGTRSRGASRLSFSVATKLCPMPRKQARCQPCLSKRTRAGLRTLDGRTIGHESLSYACHGMHGFFGLVQSTTF